MGVYMYISDGDICNSKCKVSVKWNPRRFGPLRSRLCSPEEQGQCLGKGLLGIFIGGTDL